MNKCFVSLLAMWLGAALVFTSVNAQVAQGYGHYYKDLPTSMPVVTAPAIPSRSLSLSDFGCVGDGMTLNTEAFAKAIAQLSAQGGGHLLVPAGIFLTGSIELKSNIDLHLDRNATILFSPDKELIVPKDTKTGKFARKAQHGIWAEKCENISITGSGIIDGNGEWWRAVKRGKVSDEEWKVYNRMGGTVTDDGSLWYPYNLKHFNNVAQSMQAQEGMRVHMVRFVDCSNVLVQGVTLKNSPKFHLVPNRCQNLIVDGVQVLCEWNVQNGDGIDIGNCKNVLVVNCTVNVGDDGICMKGGVGESGRANGPCENILIVDNKVYHGHGGFVIGSDVSGGMRNIVVERNTFSGTDTGLRFKSSYGRGGKTERIFVRDIYMNDIKNEAIVFETTYQDRKVGSKGAQAQTQELTFAPDFGDIQISNVTCSEARSAIVAHGDKGMVHDISISNSTFFYSGVATDIDEACDVKLSNVVLKGYEK